MPTLRELTIESLEVPTILYQTFRVLGEGDYLTGVLNFGGFRKDVVLTTAGLVIRRFTAQDFPNGLVSKYGVRRAFDFVRSYALDPLIGSREDSSLVPYAQALLVAARWVGCGAPVLKLDPKLATSFVVAPRVFTANHLFTKPYVIEVPKDLVRVGKECVGHVMVGHINGFHTLDLYGSGKFHGSIFSEDSQELLGDQKTMWAIVGTKSLLTILDLQDRGLIDRLQKIVIGCREYQGDIPEVLLSKTRE